MVEATDAAGTAVRTFELRGGLDRGYRRLDRSRLRFSLY
jgi:hypothetical protein